MREIAVIWAPEVKKLDLPQEQELRRKCGSLADGLASRLSEVYAEVRSMGLNRPSDVAAYDHQGIGRQKPPRDPRVPP